MFSEHDLRKKRKRDREHVHVNTGGTKKDTRFVYTFHIKSNDLK